MGAWVCDKRIALAELVGFLSGVLFPDCRRLWVYGTGRYFVIAGINAEAVRQQKPAIQGKRLSIGPI